MSEQKRGKWIAETGALNSMSKADTDALKAYLARTINPREKRKFREEQTR